MKLLKFIAVIVLLSGMVSCGVQRNLEESRETDAHYHETSHELSLLEQNIESMVRMIMSENINKLLVQEIVSETEQYSKPDSSGLQHVIQRTRTQVRTDLAETSQAASEIQRYDTTEVVASIISAKESYSALAEHVMTEEKRGAAWWQTALMWAGVAAIAIILLKIALRLWK